MSYLTISTTHRNLRPLRPKIQIAFRDAKLTQTAIATLFDIPVSAVHRVLKKAGLLSRLTDGRIVQRDSFAGLSPLDVGRVKQEWSEKTICELKTEFAVAEQKRKEKVMLQIQREADYLCSLYTQEEKVDVPCASNCENFSRKMAYCGLDAIS